MISDSRTLRDSVIEYCAQIGADSMLVQGSGGNISWKDGETLWIKASGTCIADAAVREIFVPVDLAYLQQAITAGNFNVSPRLFGDTSLRPSIETLLHALIPTRLVVHLHPVEVLARLVRSNSASEICSLTTSSLRWLSLNYFKPGADLARVLAQSLKSRPSVNVIFLKNHGIVIGGEDIEEIRIILNELVATFTTHPRHKIVTTVDVHRQAKINELGYRLLPNYEVNQLALNRFLFSRLRVDWALYPDHVVFLGPKAICFDDFDAFMSTAARLEKLPELVFIRDLGVFASEKFRDIQEAHINCYAAVMFRQSYEEKLDSLTDGQISELLDWDAEIYRRSI